MAANWRHFCGTLAAHAQGAAGCSRAGRDLVGGRVGAITAQHRPFSTTAGWLRGLWRQIGGTLAANWLHMHRARLDAAGVLETWLGEGWGHCGATQAILNQDNAVESKVAATWERLGARWGQAAAAGGMGTGARGGPFLLPFDCTQAITLNNPETALCFARLGADKIQIATQHGVRVATCILHLALRLGAIRRI